MSGAVFLYNGVTPIAGATVECQGKSTITLGTGAYDLPGLMSGATTVRVRWQDGGGDTIQDFQVQLKPGPNQVDFRAGP